jgi:hypothetical protein
MCIELNIRQGIKVLTGKKAVPCRLSYKPQMFAAPSDVVGQYPQS